MQRTRVALGLPSPLPAPRADAGILAGRRLRAWGWLGSCAVHGLLCALASWGLGRPREDPPPTVRLVFVEPPPPAPLGVPAASGTTPAADQPPAVVEKPKEDTPQVPVKPKRKEPDRLKIAKKKKESPPQRQPAPELEPVSPSVPETGTETATTGQATPQAGLAAGAVGGIAGGVVGGVQGGVIGGVIGGSGSGPIPVGQVANPPLLLSRVVPEYPQLARRRGIEGLVVLEAILDRQGKIEDEIKVFQSVPLLDEAAIKAVRQWRFKPARDQHGRAVRVILEVPIRFVLN